jgi:hypothetical protein
MSDVVLLNGTNETLEHLKGGLPFTFPPYPEEGCMKKVDSKVGNFLLTALGQRGLQMMAYGDDKEKKIETSRRINLEFKRRQVINHNRLNENNRNSSLAYIEPTRKIIEYAEELGLALMSPYTVKELENNEMNLLKRQLKQQADVIDDLRVMISDSLGNKGGPPKVEAEISAKEEPGDDIVKSNRKRYASLSGNKLSAFVKNHVDEINKMPIQNRSEVHVQWKERIEDEPFPEEIQLD